MPTIPDKTHSDVCDGFNLFMLYGPLQTLDMRSLRTVNLQNLAEFEHVYTIQPSGVYLAEICGGRGQN